MVLRRAYLGKMVILGLRPEDLQDETTASAHRICYEENQLKAFVDLREMIGAEAYLHMNTGKNLITARVPSEVPVTVKEICLSLMVSGSSPVTAIIRTSSRDVVSRSPI